MNELCYYTYIVHRSCLRFIQNLFNHQKDEVLMENISRLIKKTVLVAEDDPILQKLISTYLIRGGFEVICCENGKLALAQMKAVPPDLIVSDIMMPEMDGLEFLRKVRTNPQTAYIPFILLTAKSSGDDMVQGLNMGADDYLPKPFDPAILLARVNSKINRPPIPAENLIYDRPTGLRSLQNFRAEASRELLRSSKGGKPGYLAILQMYEVSRLQERLGEAAGRELSSVISSLLSTDENQLNLYGYDPAGKFLILLPEQDEETSNQYLRSIVMRLSEYVFHIHGESLHLTTMVGYASFEGEKSLDLLFEKAQIALEYSASQLDLLPKAYNYEAKAAVDKLRKLAQEKKQLTPLQLFYKRSAGLLQFLISLVLYLIIPFFLYILFDRLGIDISKIMYYLVVAALVITALVIWIEGFKSLKDIDPPNDPNIKYPLATAIIAAYLPNEAYTIVETVNSFLGLNYPNELQIILAYNTPQSLPVEKKLLKLSEQNNRLVLLKVEGSESKSQNVNAAIALATGEFVGIFDADHHPMQDAFIRAWKWLASGYDVVQGHCLVRNYDASWISRMIAIEFESIYAVSHPGRTRLYGFGIFGGSNGYWKTDLLRQIRMHGFMLTEDIDSSMRVTESGHRIATDPKLVSRELAPGSVKALWNQRMRWAQGWFQVSLEHFLNAVRSKNLTPRQKTGAAYLLAWREIYPWISSQVFPIIAFWVFKFHGVQKLDWLVPVFVLTTLFTASVGPGQALFAYLKADPEIKQHKAWFFWYLVFSSLVYTEFKNIIARVAQIKELMGERSWRVTPRE
jgi:PleD family two-component response regulator/cellulose synthase/poly-beta-1,6-N-acetylglucosamine synthase-like glycosyltransferase